MQNYNILFPMYDIYFWQKYDYNKRKI